MVSSITSCKANKVSYFKNALLFGNQNFSSGDHFTKGNHQMATSEKLELGALHICSLWHWLFAFINCQVSFIFGRSKLTSLFSKRPPSNSSVYAELSQSNMYIVFSRLLLTELCFENV